VPDGGQWPDARAINRIGNDGGGGVRLRRGPRQYGDGVGDAERETAPVASAGGDPSRGIISADDHRSHQAMIIRPVHQTYGELFPSARYSAMSPPLLT